MEGGPLHGAAFHIVAQASELSAEEAGRAENKNPPELIQPDDFLISGGHYYVDGILCENEHIVAYRGQKDLPDPERLNPERLEEKNRLYLVYLDVWQRHLTALDDPHIRESAL